MERPGLRPFIRPGTPQPFLNDLPSPGWEYDTGQFPAPPGHTLPELPAQQTFAALDLGTNNCRLMVAVRTSGGYRVVDTYSQMVRLGEGLQGTGRLGESAMDRTLEVLRVCALRLGRRQPARFRAIATEACRRATNGDAFLERVRKETGIPIEVISGREEAELAVESCAGILRRDPARSRGLLIDIGGGSTEVAWVRLSRNRQPHELIGFVSAPVGVITLSEMFPRGNEDYPAMVEYVASHLRPFERVHCISREMKRGTVQVVGTSGTVTTLACLALRLPRYIRSAIDGFCLGSQDAMGSIAELRAMKLTGMDRHPCIGPDRSRYILPGCAIFEAIHSVWTGEITVADRGLRDGMLLRMMRSGGSSHQEGRSMRGRSVRAGR
ncbi:Ppx/GppA family phosphatase [Acetobacter sp. AN02]|uniref:Ppx/GppA phosphatase family protein n=1 Tax=Acetobacter sp. AN02 TaxID=2894186 RepID=UPI00243432BC|nr:Ppx/GppA phosphatase family protein [Acetobacter sp. AN02]MDG6095781.1 Ppx/GppA family phosphatase [Acetobacter sp. AN02]